MAQPHSPKARLVQAAAQLADLSAQGEAILRHQWSELRQRGETLLRQGVGVARELRRHDKLIYCTFDGDLQEGGEPFRLHYLGRQRFAHDFETFFARPDPAAAPARPGSRPLQQSFVSRTHVLGFLRARQRLLACPKDADMLVVDQFLLPGDLAQRGPTYAPFLNATLPITADLEAQLGLIRSKGHRRKLQAVLKGDLHWRKSHDQADFALWYDSMYRPFVQDRFGGDASVVPRAEMQEIFAKRGFLLLLEEDGVAVSGALMYTARRAPGSLNYWKYALRDSTSLSPSAFGERNAKTEAMVLSHTVAAAYRALDFGLTRALPRDGIFVHKKRIGCDFRVPAQAPRFALHLSAAARARFTARYPLVVLDGASMQAWVGQVGSLSGAAQSQLRDSLNACGFAALGGVKLFTDAAADADAQLGGLIRQAEADLGVPVAHCDSRAAAPTCQDM